MLQCRRAKAGTESGLDAETSAPEKEDSDSEKTDKNKIPMTILLIAGAFLLIAGGTGAVFLVRRKKNS